MNSSDIIFTLATPFLLESHCRTSAQWSLRSTQKRNGSTEGNLSPEPLSHCFLWSVHRPCGVLGIRPTERERPRHPEEVRKATGETGEIQNINFSLQLLCVNLQLCSTKYK